MSAPGTRPGCSRSPSSRDAWIALGAGIGTALGAGFGTALGTIASGAAIGTALGTAVGVVFALRARAAPRGG